MANAVLKDITIGESSFKSIFCVVGNTKRLNDIGCLNIDVIIGTSLIKLCNWKLNPSSQIISFSKNSFKKEENSLECIVELTASQLPIIKFNYDNIFFYALIDSGFSDYFELNKDILKKSKRFKKLKRIKGAGQYALTLSDIQTGLVSNLIIDSLYAKSASFVNIPTQICNCKPKLGSGVLKRYIFVYNFLFSVRKESLS